MGLCHVCAWLLSKAQTVDVIANLAWKLVQEDTLLVGRRCTGCDVSFGCFVEGNVSLALPAGLLCILLGDPLTSLTAAWA